MLPSRLPKKSRRETAIRSPGHRAWVRSHYCSVPGCMAQPVECAHVRTAANSGWQSATIDETAEMVRRYCGVASRRDLAIDGDARKRFLALVERYEMDTGRRAWVRPGDRRQTA